MATENTKGQRRQKRPEEAVSGLYSAIPIKLLDSVAFTGASHPAKALLLEALRQHNGQNNGRLQLTYSWLSRRSWNSRDVIQRAVKELIERGLLIQTKRGGLNMGPNWYALTWLQITNYIGLDIEAKQYRQGAWALMNKLPLPKIRNAVPPNGTGNTAGRDSTSPANGTANAVTVP